MKPIAESVHNKQQYTRRWGGAAHTTQFEKIELG